MEIAFSGGRWEGMVLSVCILGQAIHRTFHPVLPHHTDCRDLEHPQGHPQKNPWGIRAVCSPSYLHFLPLSSLTLLPKVRSQQTFPSDGSQRKFLSKKESRGGGDVGSASKLLPGNPNWEPVCRLSWPLPRKCTF